MDLPVGDVIIDETDERVILGRFIENEDNSITLEQTMYRKDVIETSLSQSAIERMEFVRKQTGTFNFDERFDARITVAELPNMSLNLLPANIQRLRSTKQISVSKKAYLQCNLCGGVHLTHECPQKNIIEKERAGQVGAADSSKFYQAPKVETYSVKIDPLPQGWKEETVKNLVTILHDEVRKGIDSLAKKEAIRQLSEEDEHELARYRAALPGLMSLRVTIPRKDDKKVDFCYCNLGSKEAQLLFVERYNGSKIESHGMVIHVLLPEEYKYGR